MKSYTPPEAAAGKVHPSIHVPNRKNVCPESVFHLTGSLAGGCPAGGLPVSEPVPEPVPEPGTLVRPSVAA